MNLSFLSEYIVTSKLILFFLVIGIVIYSYINMIPVIITAPTTIEANSFFEVQASHPGQWLVTGARASYPDGDKIIILAGNDPITVVYSPGLIIKEIEVTTITPLSEFTKLVHSWSPATGREAVASSLYALGVGFSGTEVNDLIKLTKLNNQALIDKSWKPFFLNLGKYCEENMADLGVEEHKALWIKIANALREQE